MFLEKELIEQCNKNADKADVSEELTNFYCVGKTTVSNRRELLIAFYHYIQENDIDHNIPQRIEKMVDKYLSNL